MTCHVLLEEVFHLNLSEAHIHQLLLVLEGHAAPHVHSAFVQSELIHKK